MNILTFTNLDDQLIELNVPENFSEITGSQLLQLDKEGLTDFEILAILCNIPVETLYNANYEQIEKQAKIFVALFQASKPNTNISLPKKLFIKHNGQLKKVKLGNYLSLQPAGAAAGVYCLIADDLAAFAGDRDISTLNFDDFSPKPSSCVRIANEFLYWPVTGKPYSDEDVASCGIAESMPAIDVLRIAQYFYVIFPKTHKRKPLNWLQRLYKKQKHDSAMDFRSTPVRDALNEYHAKVFGV